ncbi:hypothetical protein J1G42_02415 [Cellulomonas sp. zg-ZUI222]|uniref:hypothetical protein n=1 Tax=Cellulomonas wangleii TaxID=2816956 RepID=UPI001A942971|nr:hypothetical protein [Cellulomonas wangleii]MBO0919677.1 hypothetical protein [Cellulomonas wangleii]
MSARFGSEGFGAWVLDRIGPTARAPRGRGEPPEVTVRTGPSVPAVAVRAVLALAAVVAALVAGTMPGGMVPSWVLTLLVVVALAPAVVPRVPVTAFLVLAVGVRVLLADPASPLVLAVLVLALHVVLRLAALVARIGWRGRIEVAVLTDDLRAAVAVQVGAQALALLAGAAAGAGGAAGGGWRVVGMLAVAGLAAAVMIRPVRPWWRGQPDA